MSSLRSGSGLKPVAVRVPSNSGPALAIVAALLLGGCAQSTSKSTAYDPSVSQPPYQVASETGRKPDLEDDGREAQLPPLKKARPEPDDPHEPWSRNYGSARTADAAAGVPFDATPRAALGAIVRGPVPSDLPPDFRRRLASAVDE